MNLFDCLKTESRKKKPKQTSSEPTLAICLKEDESSTASTEEATEHNSPSRERFNAQQVFLGNYRAALAQMINESRNQRDNAIRYHQNLLNSHVHVAKWDDLWPHIDALTSLPEESKHGVYILGGWHSGKEDIPASLPTAPEQLCRDLKLYAVYAETLKRYADIAEAAPNDRQSAAKKFSDWVQLRAAFFQGALDENRFWKAGVVRDFSKSKTEKLVSEILHQLLFAENQAFCFYPSPEKPLGGWRDFYSFCFGHNHLVNYLQAVFGFSQFTHRHPSLNSLLVAK
jgi:hypothetical protein